MAVRRVNFGSWLLRILTWDGLLPASVVLVPTVIESLLPNNRGAIELAAVAIPIAGFFLRVSAGKRQIASNNCDPACRVLQFCAFFLGILVLTLIDAVVILSHVMPQGAAFADETDCIVWAILVAVYLSSMGIAMYPGRTEADRQWANAFAESEDVLDKLADEAIQAKEQGKTMPLDIDRR
jgi:hypothetical protein